MPFVRFMKVAAVLPLLLYLAAFATAAAQVTAHASPERFAGEATMGAQPSFPIHIELLRSGEAVTGTVSIAMGNFELVDAQGDDTIVGGFEGAGGSGALTLRIDGDALTGAFDLAGQAGTITATRTSEDAAAFFRPPEERLDLTADEWLEDLDRLVEILTQEHASPFHAVSSEQFEREAARVRAAIPERDGVGVALEFRKLAALIGDGHTVVNLPHGRPRLPTAFFMFEDGLRVVKTSAANEDLLGARLVSVNGVPVDRVIERLNAYIPAHETEWFLRAELPGLLGNPDLLRVIGSGDETSFVFTFETTDGQQRLTLTDAEPGEEQATLGGGAPLWQRNEKQGFWSERLADGSLYVNWRSYDGLADGGAALLESLDADHPRRLLVDLRDNDGGDYTVGRAFIDEIASRPWLNRRGVLYVMIGRETFSAAMTNAVDFKQKTEATLVGEPAGAAPNNWQEVRRFNLPNSALTVGVSTRYHEFLPGQPELRPDHLISPVPQDWGNAHDAGAAFVLEQPVP